VREAGDRAKVAVYSRERDVDPVGACVGMKGTRVPVDHPRAARREDRHRRMVEDPILFVTNAISPAKVQRVSIVDDAERVMEVIVEDKQLSLGDRQEGPERPAGGEADRLEDRHQERRRKAPRGRAQLGALEIGEPEMGEPSIEEPESGEPVAEGEGACRGRHGRRRRSLRGDVRGRCRRRRERRCRQLRRDDRRRPGRDTTGDTEAGK
jgi:hypothetical protein